MTDSQTPDTASESLEGFLNGFMEAATDDTDTTPSTESNRQDTEPLQNRDSVENAVSEIHKTLSEIAQTGVTESKAMSLWIDHLLGKITGNNNLVTAALDSMPTEPQNSQTTLTAHAANDTNWFDTRFDAASEQLIHFSHETDTALLSPLFRRLSLASDELSQNFTPPSIVEYMVQSTLDIESLQEYENTLVTKPLTAADPSCGAGIFLQGLGTQLRQLESPPPAIITGQDIDPTAAKASVITMAIHGIPGFVIHGDTLLNETRQLWRVGPVAPDPNPTIASKLPADVFPDGMGSIPENTAELEKATEAESVKDIPDEIASIEYNAIPLDYTLFDAHNRLDPANGITPDY